MYIYDDLDRQLVAERVDEFRDQVARRLSGALTEDEFKPLRLMNGVYLQLHAYMLRVAVPYGTLSSDQLRTLARVARRYDRGYGHFTTRQNIQFNWIKLQELPDAMAELARAVSMASRPAAIACATSPPISGQASRRTKSKTRASGPKFSASNVTLHPEFSFLPRKFKIAVTASGHDRAAIKVHDLGLRLYRNASGESGFEVLVGGASAARRSSRNRSSRSCRHATCSATSRRSCASTTSSRVATTSTRRG